MDLLSQLIVLDPDERLGHEQGCADIFSHPFFAQLDHSTPLWQQYSPYTPTASQATDGGTTAADQREMSLLLEDVDAAASGPDQSPGNRSLGSLDDFQTVNLRQIARMQLKNIANSGNGLASSGTRGRHSAPASSGSKEAP